MSEFSNTENLERKTFQPHTTGGVDRSLEEYEHYLGFSAEEEEGKTILDLGSGATERLSRELGKKLNESVRVVSLNPDYKFEELRKNKKVNNPSGKSVAGVGQDLPFKDKVFDDVLALASVSEYVQPQWAESHWQSKYWLSEIYRVLKSGGRAFIFPFSFVEHGGRFVEYAQELGFQVSDQLVETKHGDDFYRLILQKHLETNKPDSK